MRSNQDRPEKFDSKIDAALKSLSETAPPAGMVSRIQLNLETAATAGRARRGWLFWIPATCAALAAVLLTIFFQMHSAREKQMLPAESAKMTEPLSTPPEVATYQIAQVPKDSSEPKISTLPANLRQNRRERPRYRHATNLLSYPLTQQEKLLVRFAQTANPEDLQALNPEYQAKIEAQQEAEFAAYVNSDSSFSAQETAGQTNPLRSEVSYEE